MRNLDTQMLVALLTGDLSEDELHWIKSNELAIADIVLWELAKLVEKKRIILDLESGKFRAALRHFAIIPISLDIALKSTQLDFSSDPADELIAASSVVKKIPLLTRDRRIRKSRIVPLAIRAN